MIHIITPENQHLYQNQLRQHHAIRHQIYIEEREWVGLRSSEGLEYDDFDTPYATYTLAIENDCVIGGARFYPTQRKHMLETVCPQLADVKGIPRADNIYEWTRLFVIPDRREGRYGGAVMGQVLCGGIEYCLYEGIDRISLVFEAWWLPRVQAWGWRMDPLGLPGLINGEWWLAGTVPINERMLGSTRSFFQVKGPQMIRRGLAERPDRTAVA